MRVEAYRGDDRLGAVEHTLLERRYRTTIPLRFQDVDRLRVVFERAGLATVSEISVY